jgi:DNA-binding CsgD family transcriptional regulator
VRAELALWTGRPREALAAIESGLARADPVAAAAHRVRLCAVGLRAYADLAGDPAGDRSGDPTGDPAGWRDGAGGLLREAGRAARYAAAVTPEAAAWRAVAVAEHDRVAGHPDPGHWQAAAAAWEELGRPYQSGYCRWRLAEALLAAGAPEAEVVAGARQAHRTALRLRARPLARALDRLAGRIRIDLVGLQPRPAAALTRTLGLTAREGEVLALVSRGYTNRGIARELAISVKTASVHVTHILRKLGVATRSEAAAVAHRCLPAADRSGAG